MCKGHFFKCLQNSDGTTERYNQLPFSHYSKIHVIISVSVGILPHSVCEIRASGRRTSGKVTFVPKLLAENLPTGKVVDVDTFTEHPVPLCTIPHTNTCFSSFF